MFAAFSCVVFCAVAAAAPVVDVDVEGDLERAFALLGDDDRHHGPARELLVRATSAFEDQSLAGSDLEKAYASDAKKAYRGRPHERVLAHVVLAALEMERGRCDLALPSLKAAEFFDLKASANDSSDAVVVHALTLRCLIDAGAASAEVDAARANVDVDVARRVLDPQARLTFAGLGPRFARGGSQGEVLSTVDRSNEAGATFVIRLGRRASRNARVDKGVVVWDSHQQATTIRGRPFDQVLQARATTKTRAQQSAQQNLGNSQQRLRTARGGKDLVAAAVGGAAGVGLLSFAAVTDARADDRCVDDLPGTVRLASSR